MNAITKIPAVIRTTIVSLPALVFLACAVFLTPTGSWAQSTWVGGTSSDWSVAGNWNPSGVPSGVDTVVNTSSGNIATVSTDVSASQPSRLRIGDGTTGTINVQSGGNLTVNGETWIGNSSTGVGTNNLNGGIMTGMSWFAVGRGGGNGTMNVTGGALTVSGNPLGVALDAGTVGVLNQSGGTITCSDHDFWVGNNDQGGSQNSAAYNLSGGSIAVNSWLVIGRHNTVGVLNISGGSMTKTDSGNGDQFLIGVDQASSTGIINQTGGAITNTLSDTYLAAYGHGTGTWNLNGGLAVLSLLTICHDNNSDSIGTMNLNTNGTLIVSMINGNGTVATSTFNFNGGTLIANGANASFISGLTAANVRNGGAIINDGGFAIAITQPLVHSTIGGDNATDGGLTKNGSGTLDLSGVSSYTGDTVVNAGTLQLDGTGSSVGKFRLANGALLNLNFSGNYAVAGFFTNGVALSAGTYNAGNLGSFITGPGNLVVSSSISTGIWTGLGANNNWSTAGNWDHNAEPIFPIGLTFAGSTRLANTNDLSSITVSSLTFDAAAGAFVLNGNDITLNGNIGFNGNPASPVTQTVNLNMNWNADKTIDTPTNGNLTLGGNITTSANNLTKIDAGTLTLGGINSFAGFSDNGGTVTITGNTMVTGTGGNDIYLGNGDAIANSKGTLIIQPAATLSFLGSYGDDFVVGRDGGSGTVVQNGGTFTFDSNRQNMWLGATGNSGTSSEYDMNGGLLDMSFNNIGLAGSANSVNATAKIIQTGGVITNVNQMNLSVVFGGSGGNGISTYTLSGGSLYFGGANGFTAGTPNYAINLGGGTVGAEVSWASSLNMTLTGSNGPVTFNSGGNTITLSGVLSGSGGLVVAGSGTLDLAGTASYLGNTIVNAGSTLELDQTGSNPGTFNLANGATLKLTLSGTFVVGGCYTNGVALAVGTYNAGNLPGFITGSGSLQVVSGISTGLWTGDGANNNWSSAGNWNQSAVPVFPIGLTFAGSTRLVNNNDLTSITASSITFDVAAGAFVLNGNDITLAGNIGFNGNPAAPIIQTVNLNWLGMRTRQLTRRPTGTSPSAAKSPRPQIV